MRLQVISGANARISHDCRAAALFVGSAAIAIAAARTCRAVKRMVAAVLMAHFMSNIINPERVADGTGLSGDALSFSCRTANRLQTCNAAATRAEHMADVIVGGADY